MRWAWSRTSSRRSTTSRPIRRRASRSCSAASMKACRGSPTAPRACPSPAASWCSIRLRDCVQPVPAAQHRPRRSASGHRRSAARRLRLAVRCRQPRSRLLCNGASRVRDRRRLHRHARGQSVRSLGRAQRGVPEDGRPELWALGGTGINVSGFARASNVNFTAAIGPLGVYVTNGSAVLNAGGGLASNTPASFLVELPSGTMFGRLTSPKSSAPRPCLPPSRAAIWRASTSAFSPSCRSRSRPPRTS